MFTLVLMLEVLRLSSFSDKLGTSGAGNITLTITVLTAVWRIVLFYGKLYSAKVSLGPTAFSIFGVPASLGTT